ncbi:hypothetical protein [Desulfosporosinus sp. BG]|uniref:hypothetical protein n=1 Tax=Desulfosporosinus sp. BG TaxID=1633135 RepID=UPI00083A01CD|nr:hypothetical protein [Desulfosporosinus sp. BG]
MLNEIVVTGISAVAPIGIGTQKNGEALSVEHGSCIKGLAAVILRRREPHEMESCIAFILGVYIRMNLVKNLQIVLECAISTDVVDTDVYSVFCDAVCNSALS